MFWERYGQRERKIQTSHAAGSNFIFFKDDDYFPVRIDVKILIGSNGFKAAFIFFKEHGIFVVLKPVVNLPPDFGIDCFKVIIRE